VRAPPRTEAREFLDGPAQDPVAFAGLLADIRRVNRWYGGRTLVLRYLEELSRRIPRRPLHVPDVATGSGDMPAEMVRWARARRIPLRILALDIHPEILTVARKRTRNIPEVRLVGADARALPFGDRSVDVVSCELALHHFSWTDAVQVLREVDRVAAGGYVVHDVLRTWGAYFGMLLDTWLFGRSRLSRHDGPLSVLRAYTLEELKALARSAGLRWVSMRLVHTVQIRAPLTMTFSLARDVERWPQLLPAYRWCRVLERTQDRLIFAMAGCIRGWPARWVAVQEADEPARRILFRHLRGITRGMTVVQEWAERQARG